MEMKEKKIDKYVGARIRSLRRLRGLSQQNLGVEVGVSFQSVQLWEVGRNRISASKLVLVANALGCKVSDLFGEHNGEPPWEGDNLVAKIQANSLESIVRALIALDDDEREMFAKMITLYQRGR